MKKMIFIMKYFDLIINHLKDILIILLQWWDYKISLNSKFKIMWRHSDSLNMILLPFYYQEIKDSLNYDMLKIVFI